MFTIQTVVPPVPAKRLTNNINCLDSNNVNIETDTLPLSYKIISMVHHVGSTIESGHYSAYSHNQYSDKWVRLSDQNLSNHSKMVALSNCY